MTIITDSNALLRDFVRKKAVGKTMSRPLESDDLARLPDLMQHTALPSVTKATLLTALLMIPSPEEAAWVKTHADCFPPDLYALFFDSTAYYYPALQHTDLSESQMQTGLTALFTPDEAPERKAIFLEALRLKEESALENRLAYNYCLNLTRPVHTDLPVIIDLGNPYDGFTRHYPIATFLAPLLASIGLPTVLHGVQDCGPKHGYTPRQFLGDIQPIETSLTRCGWGYCDQSEFCPDLYALQSLRTQIIKRPLLSTIEKLLLPVRAARTLLVTGYTHPPYKPKMTALLRQHAVTPTASALLIRGLEGSMQLPLTKRARCLSITPDTTDEYFIEPVYTSEAALSDKTTPGSQALQGEKNAVYYSLLHTGSLIASHALNEPVLRVRKKLAQAVASGHATDAYYAILK